MLRCVRHEVAMRQPVEGSTESIRAQLIRAVERDPVRNRAARLELQAPEVPVGRPDLWASWEAIQYLWTWFWDLNRARTYNGMTGHPDPLSYQALDAWARLTGRELLPHEVDALMRLDAAYLAAVAEFTPKRPAAH